MSEFLLDEDSVRQEWVRPDETGFTIRTRYRGTEELLDRNSAVRSVTPTHFRDKNGAQFHHVGSIPIEIYEQMTVRLGRPPTARECVELIQDRDYSKLKTREVKL